jgi:dihydroceramidase
MVGLLGILLHPWVEKRFMFAFGSVALVGMGSILFHGTLGKVGQLLDEVPMLYAALIFCYIFINQNHVLTKHHQFMLALGMVGLSLITTSLVMWSSGTLQFVLFHASFNSSHSYALWHMYKIWRGHQGGGMSPRAEHAAKAPQASASPILTLFYIGVVIYGCAFICWILDFFGCPLWNPLSTHAVVPFNPQFHAWWHVLVSVGLYMMVLLVLVRQAELRGGELELSYVLGILPYLKLVKPMAHLVSVFSVGSIFFIRLACLNSTHATQIQVKNVPTHAMRKRSKSQAGESVNGPSVDPPTTRRRAQTSERVQKESTRAVVDGANPTPSTSRRSRA